MTFSCDDIEHCDPIAAATEWRGSYVGDFVPVSDLFREMRCAPLEIVVKFHPRRKQALMIGEVDESPLVVKIREKAELARWIAHCRQVFEEGDLHGGSIDQHSSVPAE